MTLPNTFPHNKVKYYDTTTPDKKDLTSPTPTCIAYEDSIIDSYSNSNSNPTSTSSVTSTSKHNNKTILMIPGMGDLRHQYRFLAPNYVEKGYRVIVMDLRGNGESGVEFPSFTVEDIAS